MPLNDYCGKEEIIHKMTPSWSPKSNSVAKKENMILKRNDEYYAC